MAREYENAVERIALQELLPPVGERLVEIGAAYGRLADLYLGFQQVILLDPAKSQLREAQKRWGADERFIYVVGDVYHLPLCTSGFDVVLTVRVLHHLRDVAGAFAELHRVLRPQGSYVLEYANKRNLKEIMRFLVGRSQRKPFSREPVEYAPLHFDFHPSYIEDGLQKAGFVVERTLAVSSLRLSLLKQRLPQSWLVRVDSLLQSPTARFKLAPSIFHTARAVKDEEGKGGLFRCPACGGEDLENRTSSLLCRECGRTWPVDDGIYDFGM